MTTYPMFGCDQPLVQICLEAATYSPTGRLFGIAEYLSACAILLLVLSVSDYRYRLRLSLAGLGGQRGAFIGGSFIGLALMLVEFWFLKGWPVPAGMNDLALIQLVLGAGFLGIVLYCCWAVFVHPPVLKVGSARRWAHYIYGAIGVGDQSRLAVLAAELGASIKPMLDLAERRRPNSSETSPEVSAWLCIQLLGDPRMVKALVRSAPWTVAEIFSQLKGRNLQELPIDALTANIGSELVTAKESPLSWETVGYTGYFKRFQPVGTAVFGDSELVEQLSYPWGPLSLLGHSSWRLEPEQASNYAEALLIFTRDLVRTQRLESHAFNRAIDNLANAGMSISEVDGRAGSVHTDPAVGTFRAATKCASEIMKMMDKGKFKYRGNWRTDDRSVCAALADAIIDLIHHATYVRGPKDTAFLVHHSSLWGQLWSFHDGPIHRLIQKMVRRRLYLKIKEMDESANYMSARLLGYTLSVLGLSAERYFPKWVRPLKVVVMNWAKRNYLTLHRDYPLVAEAVLIGSITFDAETGELVKTYARGVESNAPEDRLKLDPPNPPATGSSA